MSATAQAAEETSRIARQRNRQSLRITRLRNGYLVTECAGGEGDAARNRAELHDMVDQFFDKLEALGPGEDLTSQPPQVDHRRTGGSRLAERVQRNQSGPLRYRGQENSRA